jgi:hypothetical protein
MKYFGYTKMRNKLHLAFEETTKPICGQGTIAGMEAFLSSEVTDEIEIAMRAFELDPNYCRICFKVNLVELEAN